MNSNGNQNNDRLATEGLMANYSEVAEEHFEADDYNKQDFINKGIAETHEQFSDDYFSGNNDVTFLRDGQDMVDDAPDQRD
ncbi:YozQ family protein [Paenibacillus turpanensis]|uniref:YozQ family protein n=1 Tax=Paenibacillus turpanensis TaxID=2689078 RepID=UPI001FB6E282|nr:YozQ family protein [Paenibacillus turpanensis]